MADFSELAYPPGAAFGVGSPAETAQQPTGMSDFLAALYRSLGGISKRAIGNSQTAVETGYYNPDPVIDAALLPMNAPVARAVRALKYRESGT